jgi:hypothetical protein
MLLLMGPFPQERLRHELCTWRGLKESRLAAVSRDRVRKASCIIYATAKAEIKLTPKFVNLIIAAQEVALIELPIPALLMIADTTGANAHAA